MVSEVPITRETAAQYQTLNVQFARGPAQAMQEAGDSLGDIGRAIDDQAQKKALMEYSIGMKENLFRIEQENTGDPDKMTAAFDQFRKGYLGKINDTEVSGALTEQFLSQTQPAIRRAGVDKRQRLESENRASGLILAGLAKKNIEGALPGLFDEDPGVVQESARKLQAQAFSIQKIIDLKDGEGKPLYTPEKRAEMALELAEIQSFLEVEKGAEKDAPLSVRNNNPGNIRGKDGEFMKFATPEEGKQAMEDDLLVKISGKSKAMEANFGKGYKPTLANVISTWAPSNENDTAAYIETVSKDTGIAPDKVLTKEDLSKVIPSMTKVEGGEKSANYFASGQLPPTVKKAFEKKMDEELAREPAAFLQKLESGAFDQYMDASMKGKYRKDATTMFKDGEERARIVRITSAAASDKAIYDEFTANSPDMLQKIEDYRAQGGNEELANYMRDNYLKANPVPRDEENQIYTSLYDRVNQLKITTTKGKVKVGNKDAGLEDVIRLQAEIMKESVRGVGNLQPLLKKLSPAILEKAKQERGKDDLGVDSFFGMFRTTEAYDPGYAQIQGWLEGQGKENDHAAKAELLREFITRADAIPEEIQNDDALFEQTQNAIARDVIAKEAGKGMKAIPVPAIQRLIANPGEAAQFDEMFGAGSSNRILGRK